jgi:pimeloyl-ACP methyl ester carboxylesterase
MKGADVMDAKRFTINIPQAALDDLQERLRNSRFPDEPEAAAAGWQNGTDVTYMKELVDYWQHKYDWRKHELALNKFAHFKAQVNGVDIHFIHERSKKPNAKALILTHGWPDSFYRFHKVIPLLTDTFDVVVPSLPGFGFSERRAMNSSAIADLWAKLMTEVLGYESFLAAGGDLGSPVTKSLAKYHANVVQAVHLTDVGYPTGQEDPNSLTEAEQEFVNMAQWWSMTEGAYLFVQGNKPQSLAYGLNDSPVGLAAWIVSFVNGGNEPTVADDAFRGRDELLTNIMIYWLTETAGSAARMYREEAKTTYGGDWNAQPAMLQKSDVPAAVALFPGDSQFPLEWAERQGLNVKRFTRLPKGGHFAALDAPEVFVKDVSEAFTELA